MTIAATVEHPSPQCLPDDHVADHIARQLRSSRLTVLYGGAAHSVSQFIAASVAPRLGRRRWDRCLTRVRQEESTGAVQGRHISQRRSGASAELLVLMDRWSGCTIATLQERINDAFESAGAYMTSVSLPMAGSLSAWSRLLDLHFLIILDRFEEFLVGRAETDDGRRFTNEFVQLLRDPGSAVNFLVCAAADSEPAMQRYQAQWAGLEQATCVRLPLPRLSMARATSDLTLIEWRQAPFAPERAAHAAESVGNRPLRARGGLFAACAATTMALAVFCWPLQQPDSRLDAAGNVTLAARALERGVSELLHRL
jgi:hypothetical protein